MACHSTALIVLPTLVTATTAASAISATSIVYSMRSWPSSVPARRLTAAITRCIRPLLARCLGSSMIEGERRRPFTFIVSVLILRLRRRQLRGDVDAGGDALEDLGDLVAGRGHGNDAAQRDQRDEHRV